MPNDVVSVRSVLQPVYCGEFSAAIARALQTFSGTLARPDAFRKGQIEPVADASPLQDVS